MRSHRLLTALVLAGALAAPAAIAGPAAALADSCRVELHDIDAYNVAERDGQDELRFRVDGNLFPRFGDKYHAMRSGDDADPGDFGNPTTLLVVGQNVTFSLREVTPPAVGEGDSLGAATAWSSTCAALDEDEVDYDETTITGSEPTSYSYKVTLKLIGE